MNRSLAIFGVVLFLIGASIGYGSASLIGGGENATACQEAVDYFRATDSFIDNERTAAIAVLLKESDTTVVEQWRSAFNNMREQCS